MPGGIDINYFIRQANKLTEKIEKRKKELADETVEGRAGDGLVTVTVSGVQEVKTVRIDPKAMEDRALLEDLVVAAVNQGLDSSRDFMKKEFEKISGGVKIPGLT